MFQAPTHDANTPMVELPFWQWLAAQGKGTMRQTRKTDLDVVIDYLTEHGFVEGRDTVESDLLDTLLTVHKCFWEVAPEIAPRKLSDVFTESAEGFLVSGLDYKKRYVVAPDVIAALNEAGWIYDIVPTTTYFQISNGKVWAKYQTILGQRCIFEVLPE
jgi:hypothetical protein